MKLKKKIERLFSPNDFSLLEETTCVALQKLLPRLKNQDILEVNAFFSMYPKGDLDHPTADECFNLVYKLFIDFQAYECKSELRSRLKKPKENFEYQQQKALEEYEKEVQDRMLQTCLHLVHFHLYENERANIDVYPGLTKLFPPQNTKGVYYFGLTHLYSAFMEKGEKLDYLKNVVIRGI